MRVPREAFDVVFRALVTKVVEQQEWIVGLRFAETEYAP
jgi:hypothetical protein